MSIPVLKQTPYGPAFWVPQGDYVEQTVVRGAKNSGYNNFLKFMRPNARTACDVGANIGEITYSLAQFCQTVHSFEPVQNTYALLEKNVEQNRLTNVKTYNMGLGAVHETAEISLSNNTCGANARVAGKTKSSTQTMQILPLDSLNLTTVDIIKIDVEGYELDVLVGGEQTILRDLPIIQLEVYEPALKRARRNIQDIYDWLSARDFVPCYVKYRRITQESNQYVKTPKCIERFFVHRSQQIPAEVPKYLTAI